jgi:SnoaL-like domain
MTTTQAMAPSAEVRDTVLEFYRRMLAGEAEAANDLISHDPAMIMIGSAGEWVDDQDVLRAGTQVETEGLVAGPNPVGYANGDVGWFADQPTWVFADGTKAEMRMSAVLQREAPGWRIVLRDLDDRLRGVPKPDGTRLDELRRGLRLAYVDGAEEWTRQNVGRGLTRDELGRVIGRYVGR